MWCRNGVGPCIAPLILLTVDPAVRDAGRGAAIVDPSVDLDFWTCPPWISLSTCLPCLEVGVLLALARRWCGIVCRQIAILESCSSWCLEIDAFRKSVLVGS